MTLTTSSRIAIGTTLVAACTGCGAPSRPADPPTQGWRVHRAGAVEVKVPDAWTVTVDARTGRIEATGNDARAVVWPVFIGHGQHGQHGAGHGQYGADHGQHGPTLITAVGRHLARRLWPRATVQPGPNPAVVRAAFDGRTAVAMAVATRSQAGTAMVLYAVDAPAASFDATVSQAATMFSSIRVMGSEQDTPAPATLAYQRWTDPREGAFSLEVPQGWSVSGGSFRFAAVDVRPMIEVRSPDGAVAVRIGDSQLPTFTEPMPFFPEGSTYSPGYGVSMRVRRVAGGRSFAADYVRDTIAQSCSGVDIVDAQNRADAVQQLNAIYQQYGLSAGMDAGEVTFTCQQQGRPMRGYYFAGIQVVRMGGPAMWRAENLLGYVAAPERSAQAKDVLAHMVSSFRIDEQWMARQQQTTMATSAIVSRTNDAISKIISDTYWSRQPIESEISRRRSNAILGVEDVVDEHTGERYRVDAGSNYYWINPKGTIVGTDIDAVPRGDFRLLTVK